MDKILERVKPNIYYKDKNFYLLYGDSINIIDKLPEESVEIIFADPPYFLSTGGITCQSGKIASVNKAKWDTSKHIKEVHSFNKKWLRRCKKVLKKNGTIWISGTYHNIYSIGMALLELDYKLLNNITWYKRNAPPNLSCRYFTHSTETILWARKTQQSKHYFNYELMKELNENKQMRDVWDLPVINKKEKKHGSFPTQKPIRLLERIILASTQEQELILDPFNGSGSTGIVAHRLKRKYIGIDNVRDYLDLTINRIKDLGQPGNLGGGG